MPAKHGWSCRLAPNEELCWGMGEQWLVEESSLTYVRLGDENRPETPSRGCRVELALWTEVIETILSGGLSDWRNEGRPTVPSHASSTRAHPSTRYRSQQPQVSRSVGRRSVPEPLS